MIRKLPILVSVRILLTLPVFHAAPAAGAVTDETLSFRHPVDQVSVSASCGLGGVCAGSDLNRHTAVDYSVTNANTPAFAANFGTLRRTVDFNQSVGCSSLSCNMGNSVVIEYLQTNGEKWLSLDSHLAAKNVAGSGSRLAKGQPIGVVGCSGETLCSWCTNGNTCSTNKHAHHEHKLPDLGTLDLWPYGYMSSTEANQLRKPNETSISIAEALRRAFTTVDDLRSRGIRVLVPFFSPFTSSPGASNYEVYGIAGTPLNATITLTPTTARTFTNIGVGGRVWNNDSSNMDLFTKPSESIGANTTRTLSGARTFTAGDYNFYAYIDRHQEKPLGRGYSLKLAVLPNASSVVIDNDGRFGYTASEAGAQTVPGYYLSARLFQGGSGNWAQWRPGKAGRFEIWAHIPSGATASQVTYKIYSNGTNAVLSSPVSHASTNDQWVKLTSGSAQSWTFSTGGYVGLSVENISTGQKVGADAVKFIYLGTQ
jgi:hypothetical protein